MQVACAAISVSFSLFVLDVVESDRLIIMSFSTSLIFFHLRNWKEKFLKMTMLLSSIK